MTECLQRAEPEERAARAPARRRVGMRLARGWLVGLGLSAALGCGPASTDSAGAAGGSAWAYEKAFGEGPVRLVMRLDRTDATLADRVILEQELHVESGWESDFPEYLPDDFEGFSVVHIERPTTAPAEGAAGKSAASATRLKRLELEPDRSGTLTVAPLEVWYYRAGGDEGRDDGESADAAEESFLTEEIDVEIAVPEDAADLELRPRRGIFETEPVEEEGSWAWLGGGAILLVALIVAVVVWRRRRGAAAGPPPAPAHEIAYEALRRLVALGLVEKGELELFFVHLSSVVREYIEGRFDVHAPERTTEEFLREATRHGALGAHQPGLARFLGLSDRVKFARFEPDEGAIQDSFDTVRQFIEETRSDADPAARAA